MSKVISVVNTKGGVAKTTTSIYLATFLAKYGSVLLKDTDPQGSSTEWVEDLEDLPFQFEISNMRNMGKTKGYDYVIIDTPTGNTEIIHKAVEVSDLVIIPTEPSEIEVTRAFSLLFSSNVQKAKISKLLLTKVQTNTINYKELINALEEGNISRFDTIISKREAIKNSFMNVPKLTKETEQYKALAEEVVGLLNE